MDGLNTQANDQHLKKLLQAVVNEVKDYASAQTGLIQRLARIGIALSAEKDINRLLEMIVDEAMDFTACDAGTLYTLKQDGSSTILEFEILKNHTLSIYKGGTSEEPVELKPVLIESDGEKNFTNVSSYVALTGETIRIADVYEAAGFDFTGPKKYDEQTGYRSKSMLVVPMKNHENEIIGVLQLLNAMDKETGEVTAFEREYEEMIISLASQAAVALENAELITNLTELFNSFIRSIATAIDEKSPYTGGHIRRVTELTMMIAHAINDAKDGPFTETSFSADQLEELRIAAWMHDVGKITTPEYVIDKASKLETIYDRIELVKMRFELIGKILENDYLSHRQKLLQKKSVDDDALKLLDSNFEAKVTTLGKDLEFVVTCNQGSEGMTEKDLERLHQIAKRSYQCNGESRPYLTEDELKNLSIKHGTLTSEERATIEHHAQMTIDILKQLPFPKKLSNVPEYAGRHHEKLDGSGYPDGLTAEELSLQAKIMALADVFEALTAKDRPYKKPMKLSRATEILDRMCRDNHLDQDIYNLFIKSGLHILYASKELNPQQIDIKK